MTKGIFDDVFEKRAKANDAIIAALNHRSREDALNCVLSWFSVKDLEKVAETIAKPDEEPVTDPTAAFMSRLRIEMDRRGIYLSVQRKANNGPSSKIGVATLIWEAITESLK